MVSINSTWSLPSHRLERRLKSRTAAPARPAIGARCRPYVRRRYSLSAMAVHFHNEIHRQNPADDLQHPQYKGDHVTETAAPYDAERSIPIAQRDEHRNWSC